MEAKFFCAPFGVAFLGLAAELAYFFMESVLLFCSEH